MKLKQLHLNKFRGATQPVKVDFDLAKKITMLFGENGNGKSSIADALVCLCTESMGSIRDKSSVDRAFIKALGNNNQDVSLKLITDAGAFSAQLNASGAAFVKTPATGMPTVRHLRRSQIISLIDSEPSKRYEVLKDYIDVSHIIKAEDELRKAKKAADEAFNNIKNTINAATGTLQKCWVEEGKPHISFKDWAKTESEKDITQQQETQQQYLQLVNSWTMVGHKVNEVKQSWAQYKVDTSRETAAKDVIAELNKNNTTLDFTMLKVLTEAKDFITGKQLINHCPVCENSIQRDSVLSALSAKITAMQAYQTAQSTLTQATKAKEQTEATFKLQINSFIESLNKFIPLLKALLPAADPLLIQVNEIETGANNNDRYKALISHYLLVDAMVKFFNAGAVKIVKSINQHNLIKQQYLALIASENNYIGADRLAEFAGQALEIVGTNRKDFIDQELVSISVDIELLYQKLHPAESLGGIKLFLKPNVKNSIELNADFHSEAGITPQSVYSESHLDTLGICIFLALAKKYNDGNTILILDDVVMSVDENHLDRFIELLHEETALFSHILITTHYRPWKDRYRFSRAPSHQVHFIELRPWNINTGIKFQNGKIDIEELDKALTAENYDRQRIANMAGTVLENVLDFLSIKYQCKLARKHRNEFVLRELLDCLSAKLQKVLKVQHLIKNAEGVYDEAVGSTEQQLKPLIDELKQLSAIRNQVGAHFNFDGSMVSDPDVEKFGQKVYEFAKLLICPELGSFPDRNKSGSFHETRTGSIRLHPYAEPA
jgi:energy-coupling factor transporter ATP-binding protein EcfA2